MEDLRGMRVAVVDRRTSELALLVRQSGGVVYCVPVFRERCPDCEDETAAFLDRLARGSFQVVLFLSAAGARGLLASAEGRGMLPEVVAALRGATTGCQTPMPAAVLGEYGITVGLRAPEPFTSASLMEVLFQRDLE